MTSTTTTALAGTAEHAHGRPARRGWAAVGVAAGVLGVASVQLSTAMSADWAAIAGDADAIVASYADKTVLLLGFHTATALLVPLLLVFAAGLHRRMAQQAPAGSLLPGVAAGGLGLTAVAALLGSGLDTQFIFGFLEPDTLVASSGAFYTDWVATIPWLWLGAGIAAVALAVAALRHDAAPRWIGVVSAVLGGLTVLVGVSPLQYLAGLTAPVWLLVVALGFAFGDRRGA